MQVVMCFEVLLATILLWISLFGLADQLASRLPDEQARCAFYAGVGGLVLVFLLTHRDVNICTMM
tara:strand:+ start:472 stop:666 length:195 start_codon:yes stop_codon:yes gene_type:complete